MKDGFTDEPEKGETSLKRLTNHTGSGDVESRQRLALIAKPLTAEGRYHHVASQESYKRNFVPKRDLTR
jgi:hypothetical protein